MMERHPKHTVELFGHEEAERLLLADVAAGRQAHGLILAGPRGIGKATLAYRFARMLLAEAPDMPMKEDHPVFRRVAIGSHADLLVIEPVFDEKKEEYAREISIEQTRQIAEFLSMTPAEGAWRVVIIDNADAMGNAAANAILKILEEPPAQAVLLLVAHNPGRLLPTIRSRCRTLKLRPPGREDFARTLRRFQPELAPERLQALAELSQGSPGLALELEEQGACELYDELIEIIATLPALDHARVHALADRIAAPAQVHARWRIFTWVMLALLSRLCKASAGGDERLMRAAMLHSPQAWAHKWQQAADQLSLVERLHLDYKQTVIAYLHSLAGAEGLQLTAA